MVRDVVERAFADGCFCPSAAEQTVGTSTLVGMHVAGNLGRIGLSMLPAMKHVPLTVVASKVELFLWACMRDRQ